ncbi:hypothetical protein J8273_1106 [Carpediemonas membranifera]|uniref:Uncharacterized protein n=1 Tax=Carpediemonas membranifera TaxID=201153 RepID=A0A8J6BGT8_9EUKA|nr:hypothetical protein J8273_1106 [Carpediemonas membranifera]|eukprot:KAG9397197.1 hypothetical protein J8273_1106 [Carpediemonas membranifera]
MNAHILSAILLLLISVVYATDCLTYGITVNATAFDSQDNITVTYNVVPDCWNPGMATDAVTFYLTDQQNGLYDSDKERVTSLADTSYPDLPSDTINFNFVQYTGDEKYICVGVGTNGAFGCTDTKISIGEPIQWVILIIFFFFFLCFMCSPCICFCVIFVKVVIIISAFMFCISLSQNRSHKRKQAVSFGAMNQPYAAVNAPAFNQAAVPQPPQQQAYPPQQQAYPPQQQAYPHQQQGYPDQSYGQPAQSQMYGQMYSQPQYNPYVVNQAPPPPQCRDGNYDYY